MIADKDFFLIELDEGQVDFSKLFSNGHPVYLEIGSGKGEFISQYPTHHPDWNFIGLEVRGKRIDNILRKLSPIVNPNVRIARCYVDAKINERFVPDSISGAYIQHPDPWPKKKHHRRRLINQDFLNALSQVLKHDAFVQVSTDHDDYASWIVDEFMQNPYFEPVYDKNILEIPLLDEHIVTWFEHEQKRRGFDPKYMLYRKI